MAILTQAVRWFESILELMEKEIEKQIVHEMVLPPEYDEEKGEWKFNARAAFVIRDVPKMLVGVGYFKDVSS